MSHLENVDARQKNVTKSVAKLRTHRGHWNDVYSRPTSHSSVLNLLYALGFLNHSRCKCYQVAQGPVSTKLRVECISRIRSSSAHIIFFFMAKLILQHSFSDMFPGYGPRNLQYIINANIYSPKHAEDK